MAKVTKNAEQAQPKRSKESTYSSDELITGAYSFGVKPEIMAGALALAGKASATKAEAQDLLQKFLKRKV